MFRRKQEQTKLEHFKAEILQKIKTLCLIKNFTGSYKKVVFSMLTSNK